LFTTDVPSKEILPKQFYGTLLNFGNMALCATRK